MNEISVQRIKIPNRVDDYRILAQDEIIQYGDYCEWLKNAWTKIDKNSCFINKKPIDFEGKIRFVHPIL